MPHSMISVAIIASFFSPPVLNAADGAGSPWTRIPKSELSFKVGPRPHWLMSWDCGLYVVLGVRNDGENTVDVTGTLSARGGWKFEPASVAWKLTPDEQVEVEFRAIKKVKYRDYIKPAELSFTTRLAVDGKRLKASPTGSLRVTEASPLGEQLCH